MIRWGGAVLVLFLVVFLVAVPARADTPLSGGSRDSGTLAERLISAPIDGLTKALDLLGLEDIEQLVFTPSQPLAGPVLALVERWYTQLMVVCLFILAVIFAWHAAWLGKAVSPANRAQAKAGLARWVLALGAASFALALVRVLFALNNGLVGFAAAHAANFSVDAVQSTGSVLATAVINLGLAALKLYFNLLYTVRLVFIVVLLAISPLVIWSLALRNVRGGFALWAAELFSNIMMQASHALTLAALVSLLAAGPTHTLLDKWFAKIVAMAMLVPIGQFLRNLVSSWLYMVGLAEDQTAGFLGGFTRGLSNLGRMVGLGGGPGGGAPPGTGEGEGNDYNIGGRPPDPGTPPGSSGMGPEGGWGAAAGSAGRTPSYGGDAGTSQGPVSGADGWGAKAGPEGGWEAPGQGMEPGAAFGQEGMSPNLDGLPDWRSLGEDLPLEF
ncbi:MAG: hypothetical protein M0Z41_05255 [Peptococcaceae bacterium]|nr:hypothetical protein [Peptococcaceae bacterium]